MAGHEVKAPAAATPTGNLVDLMAALEASVNAAKAARSADAPVSVAEAKAAKAAGTKVRSTKRAAAPAAEEPEAEEAAARPARRRKSA